MSMFAFRQTHTRDDFLLALLIFGPISLSLFLLSDEWCSLRLLTHAREREREEEKRRERDDCRLIECCPAGESVTSAADHVPAFYACILLPIGAAKLGKLRFAEYER
jgi:hypothetical protein